VLFGQGFQFHGMEMTDGDGQGIGGVIGFGNIGQVESPHHLLNLGCAPP
jgi:hypothetical protein